MATLTLGTTDDNQLDTASGYTKMAQSFVAIGGTYTAVTIKKGINVGSGKQQDGSIQGDSSGAPDGTDVTNSAFTMPAGDVSNDFTYNFAGNVSLTDGTTYWIVMASTIDASNYSNNRMSTTSSYASGGMKRYNGSWESALFATWDMVSSLTYTPTSVNSRPHRRMCSGIG